MRPGRPRQRPHRQRRSTLLARVALLLRTDSQPKCGADIHGTEGHHAVDSEAFRDLRGEGHARPPEQTEQRKPNYERKGERDRDSRPGHHNYCDARGGQERPEDDLPTDPVADAPHTPSERDPNARSDQIRPSRSGSSPTEVVQPERTDDGRQSDEKTRE